uniref:PGG domain-containing protein n=1 Tax=Opuntia streptacantha TaxID=393608 RepID=A0A7C9A2I8_OPUST
MCARIRINPRLRPTYVQPMKTNMTEMRQTLSVVAVLLATLTFAAGFTVPGGFNNDTGEAIMAKKAAFLVFILADTIAMCCSMLALVCLIWSMVCDIPDKSLILVDYSVAILMAALYGTLVAFMTGVFTVISHVSLWAAIVVCIICSLVGISANKTLFFKVLSKLIPAPNQEHRN